VWTESTPPPRSWVLENVKEAKGICVMMADKVDDELLDAGKSGSSPREHFIETISLAGPSLKVVSTFSVGYGKPTRCALRI
jgi:glyoxylate/hydroxypyruvate reductase